MKRRIWWRMWLALVSLLFMAGLAEAELLDLETITGKYSGARAINDQGQVVGLSSIGIPLISHAFLYDGTMHDLGTLGGTFSVAYVINDAGQVVGVSGAPNVYMPFYTPVSS
jgi:probable HAF family extracellular repeat protein